MKNIIQKIVNFFQSKKLKQYENEISFLNRLLKSEKALTENVIQLMEAQRIMIEHLSDTIEKLKSRNSTSKKKAKKK